ncbi:putative membrane protein [Citrobacter rodentium ICC168]|uniref:Membrane protein n=1 Tax=Citrobacter rodentium (strain ICC168) TaxID=637910 RepID=D2TJQ4_CITRI|nr:putative membrane protein [Citrobacter rodentium ICC168]
MCSLAGLWVSQEKAAVSPPERIFGYPQTVGVVTTRSKIISTAPVNEPHTVRYQPEKLLAQCNLPFGRLSRGACGLLSVSRFLVNVIWIHHQLYFCSGICFQALFFFLYILPLLVNKKQLN